jgi:RES domain-containing protein
MARRPMIPSSRNFSLEGMHRLIPSRYSERETVLAEIAEDEKMTADLVLLDGATNDRIQAEQHGLAGISPYELVYGIRNAHIVNAAFTHSHASGARFNDSTRGAWYAGDELETALAECVYHKARRLGEIVVPGAPGEKPQTESSTYDDWLADFRAEFHVLEPAKSFAEFLSPGPVPACYAPSQQLARHLLVEHQSNGLVYPSVRRKGHRAIACFRPALVYAPRRNLRLEITFVAEALGYSHKSRRVAVRG